MDHLQAYISQIRVRLLLIFFANNALIVATWWIAEEIFNLQGVWLFVLLVSVPFLALTIFPWLIARSITQPTQLIWQAILHIAPETSGVPAPNLKKLRVGRELVTNLVAHVYQLASVADSVQSVTRKQAGSLDANFIASNLPLPLLVLDNTETITFANEALLKYIGRSKDEVVGNNIYSVLDLSFSSEQTFDKWLNEAKKQTVTATKLWERVRLDAPEGESSLQFDLAAYYNKANPDHIETLMVLFDHTTQYSQDDQAMSFVALAVHELRTPLTLMRGYIEVFDEELQGKLSGELQGFMHKLTAAAQQLSTFVNNILNVARIEGDQLTLRLQEENWERILQAAVRDLRLRAQVRGIDLQYEIAPNLPSVGVDPVSIYEVISNLVDNAIKYSGTSKIISIKTYLTKDGVIETTVQDFGVGVPSNIMPNLFNKFYRDHHNRAQIGGTGLGLYLSKAIVSAHGGNIWVRSKEGEGSIFGFTVQPYASLADGQKNGDNTMVRGAHGWIKNHSLYRR